MQFSNNKLFLFLHCYNFFFITIYMYVHSPYYSFQITLLQEMMIIKKHLFFRRENLNREKI